MDYHNVFAMSARSLGKMVFRVSVPNLVGLFAVLLVSLAHATTYYTYDNLGRVVQAVESNGTTTQYAYDANGNVTSITRVAGSSTLAITSLSTGAGAPGSSLTINGSGFSSIPSQDTVTIDGVAAQVIYASDNRLVVVIPVGATTGSIQITTQSGSVTSSNPFTVIPVSVNGFSPPTGTAGTVVTINGGGFDPTPANNTVSINGVAAVVSSASTTQLQVTVPSGATPGHISVTTSAGTGTSATDFFVPASGYSLTQFPQVVALSPGRDGKVYTLNAGQLAVALFDGVAGQRISVVSTNLSIAGSYTVYSPDGSTLTSGSISTLASSFVSLPPLPRAGTYAWYFNPSSTPATATFKLQTDVSGGLPTDGTATATSLAPGQSATYTFSGIAGQPYDFALTAFTGSGLVTATIYNPDNSVLANCGNYTASSNSQSCDFTTGTSGTYTLRIVPSAGTAYAFSFNTFVIQDATGTLTAGTPGPGIPLNLVPNQHGLLRFSAAAGQTLALYFGPLSTTPSGGSAAYAVSGPGLSTTTKSSATGWSTTFNFHGLSGGSYSVLASGAPSGTAISTQGVLASGVTATLPVDGSTSAFQTYVPGQMGYFTFPATAGQNVGLGLTQLSFTPNMNGNIGVVTTLPGSSYFNSATCYLNASPAPGCQITLRNLPQAGNYLITVTPSVQATTALAVTLSQDQGGSLTLGTPLSVNLTTSGQNGVFTFTASGSQKLALNVASISTVPAGTPVLMYVYDANNNFVTSSSMTVSGSLNLGTLAAGTYTAVVVPNNAATASMTLTLSAGS